MAAEVHALASDADQLDLVFSALSDPVRRRILERLDGEALLVSELAEPFNISLQAVSRHIQVLVRAGLVSQARTGRISRCSLDAEPLAGAALWGNRYAKYWQGPVCGPAPHLISLGEGEPLTTPRPTGRGRRGPPRTP